MTAYLVRRVGQGLLIIWGVYTLTFFMVNLAPGDPFQNLENPKMQKEDLDRLRAKWGYDKPVAVRYFVHLRKMFWADDEILVVDAGGFEAEVMRVGDGNGVRLRLPAPPPEIVLKPDDRSRQDFGAEDVVLSRASDGSYPPAPIRAGKYSFGRGYLQVGEGTAELQTRGVTLTAVEGRVTARQTLATLPEVATLEGEGGKVATLRPSAEGGYGPEPLPPGRWRLGVRELLVPEEPLDRAGPTFDLGTSVLSKQPVISYLARPLLNTALLASAALVLDFLLGVLIGVISAVRQNTRLDHSVTVGALFVYSMPGFWFGLMLILLFAVKLNWLPAEGMHSPNETGAWDLVRHMLLPAIVLGIGPAAATARYQRSAMLEVLSQDYVRTARAKGLDGRVVILKHALKNALLPTITLLGLSLPFLVSGSVITEQIFSWPGMGREAIKAIHGRDVFVLTGITLIGTAMVVAGNMLADILYAVVDPRVRLK